MNRNFAICAAVFTAALIWFFRSHPAPAKTADGQVVEQLSAAGSDLSKPHSIEFFLYFPEEQSARAAAAELNDPSFIASVSPATKDSRWLLQLTRSMLPVEAELVLLRHKLDALAAKHGGVYDGWGSPVVSGA